MKRLCRLCSNRKSQVYCTLTHPYFETLPGVFFFCVLSLAFLNTMLDFLDLRLVMRFLSGLAFDASPSTSMAESGSGF